MVELNVGLVELMSKRKQELEQHYRETTYIVFIDGKQYRINIDQAIPAEIQQLINKQTTAVILTAWNPRSQALPLVDNKSRNIELKAKLKNHMLFNAIGQGNDLDWPAEESFFILGIDKNEAEILAVEYEQYAYVWLELDKDVSLIFSDIWLSLRARTR